jgi:hypothetical protein
MRRSGFRLAMGLLLPLLTVSLHPLANASNRRMRKYKPPPPMAQVDVTVLKASTGKPLQNAAVVFHITKSDPSGGNGIVRLVKTTVKGDSSDSDEGNMELKTNEQGKASLDIIPIGSKVLVQVIAPGFQTYGEEYEIPSDKKSIVVKMLPPKTQYSAYEKTPPQSATTNTPQTVMGHAAPADSPLLAPAPKKH